MLKEISFGIIPIRESPNGKKEFLLIKHGAGHWGFPKGKPLEGEEGRTTACRELKEETGLEVALFLEHAPLIESYVFMKRKQKIDKTVTYYVAFVEGEVLPDQQEVIDALWCSFEQAYALITYNKEIIHKLANLSR